MQHKHVHDHERQCIVVCSTATRAAGGCVGVVRKPDGGQIDLQAWIVEAPSTGAVLTYHLEWCRKEPGCPSMPTEQQSGQVSGHRPVEETTELAQGTPQRMQNPQIAKGKTPVRSMLYEACVCEHSVSTSLLGLTDSPILGVQTVQHCFRQLAALLLSSRSGGPRPTSLRHRAGLPVSCDDRPWPSHSFDMVSVSSVVSHTRRH